MLSIFGATIKPLFKTMFKTSAGVINIRMKALVNVALLFLLFITLLGFGECGEFFISLHS